MKNGTIIDWQPELGYYSKFYYDDEKDEVTIKHVPMPVQHANFLDENRAVQNMGREGFVSKTNGETDMWSAARIPAIVQMKWLMEEGIDIRKPEHWDAVRKKLNDPDYRYLRTGEFNL